MIDEVCIVSYGGVFPEAKNASQLFANLMKGRQSINDFREPLPEGAMIQNLSHFYNKDKGAPNRTYCSMGAFLDRRWTIEFAQKMGLDLERYTSAEIFLMESVGQTLDLIKNKIPLRKCEIILGATSIDLEFVGKLKLEQLEKIGMKANSLDYQEIKKTLKKTEIPKKRFTCATAVLNVIKKKYDIRGLSFLTDAACASSLSSLYVAQQRLCSPGIEFVLTGGLETNLAPFLEIMFAKAGVLSEVKICPFEAHSKGMNHGEAVATLLICKASTAKKYELPILGVIKSCQGSSDGIKGGATEPTLEGQMLAYSRVHGLKRPQKIHYIEAHGTGTSIGDKTELQSLDKFFEGPIPIGSVKANVGHTIGAAGAVALIKCLEIIKNKMIPPSAYFNKMPNTLETKLFLNKEPLPLPKDENIRIPISSFGFGGTNFHLLLSERPEESSFIAEEIEPSTKSFLCATEEIFFDQLPQKLAQSKIRIPPKTIPQLDPMVLAGFLSIEQILLKNSLHFSSTDQLEIATISCGSESLDYTWRINDSLAMDELSLIFANTVYSDKIKKALSELPELTADSGSGILNNLVAGRASKMFNFQGPNFHIDADLISRPVGYLVAQGILTKNKSCVFVLSAIETFNDKTEQFVRQGLRADMICAGEFIAKYDLPILAEIKNLEVRG